MRLLIYGDIGGSGGYIRYCKGILGSNAIPDHVEVWFISSLPFYEKLVPIDSVIHVTTHPWIISKSRLKRYLWYLWVYPRIVRQIKPDVEFYPSGQLRVYLRKAVTIATCHNLLLFDTKELERIKNKTEQQCFQRYRKNQARSFQRSNAVIFLSNHSQKVVINEIQGIKQSTVIAHGLDPVFLLPHKRSYDFGNRINLLYVSPVFNYKHQTEVVKAIKKVRDSTGLDIHIRLIGGGDSSALLQLNKLIKSENVELYATLVGSVEYESLLEEYITADIFIFASSCETFGITLLEAMGARLPIACANRTGLPEILKDAGVYFDPDNPVSIAEALKKIISDEKLRKIIGERAYQYALRYTWEICARKTMAFVKSIGEIT